MSDKQELPIMRLRGEKIGLANRNKDCCGKISTRKTNNQRQIARISMVDAKTRILKTDNES